MGAWIETLVVFLANNMVMVAPHVGAWIETSTVLYEEPGLESLPTWERGLKPQNGSIGLCYNVAPHVGAWIETLSQSKQLDADAVAPHVGAWIETHSAYPYPASPTVAPHVGAWIETFLQEKKEGRRKVAPHVGAWIETKTSISYEQNYGGRSPRGSVD